MEPCRKKSIRKVLCLQHTKRTPQDERLGNLEKRDLCMLTTEDEMSCYILVNLNNVLQ